MLKIQDWECNFTTPTADEAGPGHLKNDSMSPQTTHLTQLQLHI
jgi:hypothetical protein